MNKRKYMEDRHPSQIDTEISYVQDDIERLQKRLDGLKAEHEKALAWLYGMTVPEFRKSCESAGEVVRPNNANQ